MTVLRGPGDVPSGEAATYRIVIQGALDQEWSERLGGLVIETTERPALGPHTTLTGRFRDQAELQGVLDTLYGMHFILLEVVRIAQGTSESEPEQG